MQEVWKPITGYEGSYEVSNLGRVRSCARVVRQKNGKPLTVRSRILKPSPLNNGYLTVELNAAPKKPVRALVHRLVMMTFAPQSDPSLIVRHIDGNRTNNRLDNLEWVTYSENRVHAYQNPMGKKHAITINGDPTDLRIENIQWGRGVRASALRKLRKSALAVRVRQSTSASQPAAEPALDVPTYEALAARMEELRAQVAALQAKLETQSAPTHMTLEQYLRSTGRAKVAADAKQTRRIGLKLSRICTERGYALEKVPHPHYREGVNLYPLSILKEADREMFGTLFN